MTWSPITSLRRHPVEAWLAGLYLLILVMVAVGGITRLTESGLSIVEWRPITGALPPLSPGAWEEEFARYQASPQFQQVNHWMTLADFQRIYFWEFVHRLLGRLIGLFAAVPWLWFVWRGRLRGKWAAQTGAPLALGAGQGALGWIMVKTGLEHTPAVSHFALAAHLSLAFVTAQWVLWLLLRRRAERPPRAVDRRAPMPRGWWATFWTTLGLLGAQIVYGAFVAGTRAGLVAPTFPDMNGAYLWMGFFTDWTDAFTRPLAIHYVHRVLAALVTIGVVVLLGRSRRGPRPVQRAAALLVGLLLVQLALGALTVLWLVPIPVAVAHQCVALLLLSAMTQLAFVARGRR